MSRPSNSFAAAHIAGLVARIFSKHPDLAPFQMWPSGASASLTREGCGAFQESSSAGFALEAGAGSALFVGLIVACGFAALGAGRLERHLPDETNRVTV